MKKEIKKMEISRFILIGAAVAATVICFAFIPMKQEQKNTWNAPASADKKTNPIASNANSIEAGRKVYIKNCKSCHGETGKGDGPKSKNLDVTCGDFTTKAFQKQTDGAIFWKITEGKKPMPSFKDDLDDDARWQVVNYIRTLGK